MSNIFSQILVDLEPNQMTIMNENGDRQDEGNTAAVADSVAASSLRRRAAAERRRRILEQSSDRIHVVIGGTPATTATTTEEETSNGNEEENISENPNLELNSGEDDEQLQPQESVPLTAEEGSSNTGSATSRLQQMRRRRFLNKQRATEQPSPDDDDKDDVKNASEPVTGDDTQQEKVAEQSKVAEEPSAEGPKYVGVAKMRRKIVAEQRQQQQTSIEKQLTAEDPLLLVVPKALRQLPIVLELFTIVLLCLAGIGMGWHTWLNNSGCFRTEIRAGDKLSLKLLPFHSTFSKNATNPRDLVAFSSELPVTTAIDDEDEFAVVQPPKKPVRTEDTKAGGENDDDDDEFHFDYEKIYAKKSHQGGNPLDSIDWILSRIFSTIRNVVSTIFFWNWFKTCPPAFLLVAAAGRQFGRMIGGACPEDAEESDENNNYDVLKFVKNFLSKTFPTLAKVYKFYTEARTDMYIVLFGWFLGLVLAHFWSASAYSSISQGEL